LLSDFNNREIISLDTTEIISSISDILVAMSTFGTFGVALYGVRSWSRELKGKANFEISRKLLEAVYRYRDSVQGARSLYISGTLDEFRDKERKVEVLTSHFDNRWKPVSESTQALLSISIEAEVLLGNEVKELIDTLKYISGDLRFSMDVFIDFEVNSKAEMVAFYEDSPEAWNQLQSKIVREPDGKDSMSTEIEDTIKKLENLLKVHLKRN
ncbi:TPA: hypothetical protein ACGUXV_004392, partial [Vibrio vulnificus]